MTAIDVKSGLITDSAKVLPDERDSLVLAVDPNKPKDDLAPLAQWLLSRLNMWRNHRRSNYETNWDLYERLWRAMWSSQDVNRKSERSTLITPGLAEAVENIVAEVEEALWGRGDSFDIKAAFGSQEDAKKSIDDNKAKLKEDLDRGLFNSQVGEALINAAVYGSGIGEILVETFMKREIAASVQAAMGPVLNPGLAMPQPGPMAPPMAAGTPETQGVDQMAGAQPAELGAAPLQAPTATPTSLREATVIERETSFSTLQSVNPRNFLIEPTARSIDKSLGVAIEEYVGSHIINAGMRDGKYRKVSVGTSAGETQLAADRQAENEYVFDKVHIIRYYGLVPKHLIFPPGQTVDILSDPAESEGEQLGQALRAAEAAAEPAQEEFVNLDDSPEATSGEKSEEPVDAEMIEAVVIIANQAVCIKAIENPYLMKDRPVVAFPWDVVPGRFWGRGVCEKGLVPQKVMDAELRARIDALAYVSAPMMGMDASRLPRGFQLTVRPGKSILTNGKPSDVLMPMHFGQLEQSTFAHSQQLDQMIQRATGSLDVIALAQKSGGDARPGAVSMMLSGIVKRHKRTLMNFIDRFYVPALRKILWRNMQFDPERYEPRNWDFVPTGTMGILQREYESQNLVSLMQTMDPQSAEYKMLLMGVVANTGLTYRRDIIEMLKQSISTAQQMQAAQAQAASDPNSLQSQLQAAAGQLQLAELQAKTAELQSRTRLQDAKTQNELLEPKFKAVEVATKGIYQVQADQQKQEFDRRLAMTDRYLKARDIASNERIAHTQSMASLASEKVRAAATVASSAHSSRANVAGAIHAARADVASARHAAHADIAGSALDAHGKIQAAAAKPRPQFTGRSAQLVE